MLVKQLSRHRVVGLARGTTCILGMNFPFPIQTEMINLLLDASHYYQTHHDLGRGQEQANIKQTRGPVTNEPQQLPTKTKFFSLFVSLGT